MTVISSFFDVGPARAAWPSAKRRGATDSTMIILQSHRPSKGQFLILRAAQPSPQAITSHCSSLHSHRGTKGTGTGSSRLSSQSPIVQGFPESGLLHCLTVGHFMQPAVAKWDERGYGHRVGTSGQTVHHVSFADDIQLLSKTPHEMKDMYRDLTDALALQRRNTSPLTSVPNSRRKTGQDKA